MNKERILNRTRSAGLLVTALLLFFSPHAQNLQPLRASLQVLGPKNIFPADVKSTVVFNGKGAQGSTPTLSVTADGPLHVITAEVPVATKSHYSVQAVWRTTDPVKKGDVLLARFSIRSLYARQESGEAVVYFFVQQSSPPHEKSVIVDISAGPDWKTVDVPFTAAKDMASGEASVCFSFGALAQKVEIASLQVLNFGNKTMLTELPVTRFTYTGREETAPWRTEALKRIDSLRTAPLTIKVVDAFGKPMAGVKVDVRMTQSDFIWGTAVNEALLANDSLPDAATYRRTLKALFNTVTIENGFKAGRWFGEPKRRTETLKAFAWLQGQGFRQRGHTLVWPAWKFNASSYKATAEKDTAAFRRLIEEGIRERMSITAGQVIAWDVINEIMHEKEFLPYLANEAPVQWYKLAKSLDPSAQLFINEYGMLNSVASPVAIREYIDTIIALRRAGAPIEAIGIQGHIGRQPRAPQQVLTDLDVFRSIGLPVQITEFDINMQDEELQADYTRDFLIACYSHPVVTGFTAWGFWQGAHWKPDAAMYKKDWTPKPNAAVWQEWVTRRWKTSLTETTNKDGEIKSRGHLGKYELRVTRNGVPVVNTYRLTKDGEAWRIIL